MFPTTGNTLSTSFRSSESEKPLRNKEARTNSHHAMHDEDLLYTTTIHNVPQVGGCDEYKRRLRFLIVSRTKRREKS
jgi:hypothetical protein